MSGDLGAEVDAEIAALQQEIADLKNQTTPDIGAVVRGWLSLDPTWAKTIPADLWEQLAKSRAGFFDR